MNIKLTTKPKDTSDLTSLSQLHLIYTDSIVTVNIEQEFFDIHFNGYQQFLQYKKTLNLFKPNIILHTSIVQTKPKSLFKTRHHLVEQLIRDDKLFKDICDMRDRQVKVDTVLNEIKFLQYKVSLNNEEVFSKNLFLMTELDKYIDMYNKEVNKLKYYNIYNQELEYTFNFNNLSFNEIYVFKVTEEIPYIDHIYRTILETYRRMKRKSVQSVVIQDIVNKSIFKTRKELTNKSILTSDIVIDILDKDIIKDVMLNSDKEVLMILDKTELSDVKYIGNVKYVELKDIFNITKKELDSDVTTEIINIINNDNVTRLYNSL